MKLSLLKDNAEHEAWMGIHVSDDYDGLSFVVAVLPQYTIRSKVF